MINQISVESGKYDDAEPKAFLWPCKGLEDEPGLFQGHVTHQAFNPKRYHKALSNVLEKALVLPMQRKNLIVHSRNIHENKEAESSDENNPCPCMLAFRGLMHFAL